MKEKEKQIQDRIDNLIKLGLKDKDKIIETVAIDCHISIPHVRQTLKDYIEITAQKLKILE